MEQLINEIMDWIFQEHGQDAELHIGIWDEDCEPHTFYATICHSKTGNVILGETSYDTDQIQDALIALIEEIKEWWCSGCDQEKTKKVVTND